MTAEPIDWLRWVRTLQSIGQAGLNYTDNAFDRDRYERVGRVAAQMVAALAGLPAVAVAEAFAADAGHPTPKVDVRGAVFRDGQVLLVRERSRRSMDAARWVGRSRRLPGRDGRA